MTATHDREHERSLRAIAAHFARGASLQVETAMRAHMPGCPECRAVYQHHLILEQLDPRAVPARERIGRALDLDLAPSRRPSPWWLVMAIPAAAAMLLAWPVGRAPEGAGPQGTFFARGRQVARSAQPSIWVYRLAGGNQPQRIERQLNRDDELAFAYSNPSGKAYLMIFGVDERGRVYWFHPAWQSGAPAPAAVRAAPGPGPHELPEAIRHELGGGRLRLYSVFSDLPLDASTVEHRLRATPGRLELPADAGGVVHQRDLEVQR